MAKWNSGSALPHGACGGQGSKLHSWNGPNCGVAFTAPSRKLKHQKAVSTVKLDSTLCEVLWSLEHWWRHAWAAMPAGGAQWGFKPRGLHIADCRAPHGPTCLIPYIWRGGGGEGDGLTLGDISPHHQARGYPWPPWAPRGPTPYAPAAPCPQKALPVTGLRRPHHFKPLAASGHGPWLWGRWHWGSCR